MRKVYNIVLMMIIALVMFLVNSFDQALTVKHDIVMYNIVPFLVITVLSFVVLNYYLRAEHIRINKKMKQQLVNKKFDILFSGLFKVNLFILLAAFILSPFVHDVTSNGIYMLHKSYPFYGNVENFKMKNLLQYVIDDDEFDLKEDIQNLIDSKNEELEALLQDKKITKGLSGRENDFLAFNRFSIGVCSMRDEFYYTATYENDGNKFFVACLDVESKKVTTKEYEIPFENMDNLIINGFNNSIVFNDYGPDGLESSKRITRVLSLSDQTITDLVSEDEFEFFTIVSGTDMISLVHRIETQDTILKIYDPVNNKLYSQEVYLRNRPFKGTEDFFNSQVPVLYNKNPLDFKLSSENRNYVFRILNFDYTIGDDEYVFNVSYDYNYNIDANVGHRGN